MSNHQLNSVVVTDCGSTTTKGIWFSKVDGKWKVIARAEAPTTVEKPVADVTIGVFNSLHALGEELGRNFVNIEESKLSLSNSESDPQMYLSTSSAGGGLQMIVIGLVSSISSKSGERAALGAGAIVQKVYSLDQDIETHIAAQEIRELRPDIILLTGGTDFGATSQVEELAELLLLADPQSRFETETKVPVVYAGNAKISNQIKELLSSSFDVKIVDNLRPSLDTEKLVPSRNAIHDVFLDHVMSQAPGYKKLQGLVSKPIIPTPVAVSKMIEKASQKLNKSILAVDIGGATTDIFSIRRRQGKSEFRNVHRTVSANLGMSYSIGNVVELAGIQNIKRWLPYPIEDNQLCDMLWNKMIRPTTLPENLLDLYVEQSAAREALSLSLKHHIELDDDVDNNTSTKDVADIFRNQVEDNFSILDIDIIIGSGGVLSHAPNRAGAGLILIDSFRPKGVTFLGIDSIFMLPHLGVLSETDADAAMELLFSECVVPLGTVISPILNNNKVKYGDSLFEIEFVDSDKKISVNFGEIKIIPEIKSKQKIRVIPKISGLKFSNYNKDEFEVETGQLGLILDGRSAQQERLFSIKDSATLNKTWYEQMGVSI